MSEVLELLAQLVAINSVNPDLVPGAAGEAQIADFCAAWLAQRGFQVHRLEERPGRVSVVGIAPGQGGPAGRGRSLLLNGHTDTVTLEGYAGMALNPLRRGGKLYGRGAYDMKGGLAAMLVAAHRAKQAGTAGDILVACVSDEEYGSLGTQEVLRHFTADAAIITEPSELDLVVAHKGFAWFEVEVQGRAAHGSRWQLGVDAIVKAGKFLTALGQLDQELHAQSPHPLLGTGSVHASTIQGGEELSSYPAQCRIGLERRTIPGETEQTTLAQLQGILDQLAATDPEFSAKITPGLYRPPFEITPDAEIVRVLRQNAQQRLGSAPNLRGDAFWTDCALLSAAGIPTVMFGPVGAGAHAAEEWVDEASVEAVTDILTDVILQFCGPA